MRTTVENCMGIQFEGKIIDFAQLNKEYAIISNKNSDEILYKGNGMDEYCQVYMIFDTQSAQDSVLLVQID